MLSRRILTKLVLTLSLIMVMSVPAMATEPDGMADYGVTPQSVECGTPSPWTYVGSYCQSAACWFRPEKGDLMDRYRRSSLCCDSITGECHYQYEYRSELADGCSCTP